VGDVHEVRLPTYINVSKKTSKALNLNVYRNLHHHHLNKQKQNFHDEVKPLLGHIPRAEKIWIHYTIFAPRNGRLDTMNVGSIVDKYFSDTLVEAKKIMDDHFGHVVLVSFSFGGVVKMDGHAIAKIHILEPENKETSDMRILLDQTDIQTALNTYVESMGIAGATGVELSIDDGEIVAEVTMGETKAAPKPKNKGGRPPGSKNKPKPAAKAEPEPEKEEVTDAAEDDSQDGADGTDSGSGESPEADSEAGAEEPAAKTTGKSKAAKGNLFADEDGQSSESPATTDAEEAEEGGGEDKTPVVKTKKSSIFDVE